MGDEKVNHSPTFGYVHINQSLTLGDKTTLFSWGADPLSTNVSLSQVNILYVFTTLPFYRKKSFFIY